MIISSILSLVSISCSAYLGNDMLLREEYSSSDFGGTYNSVLLDNPSGTLEDTLIDVVNGYNDLSTGNYVNFYFDDFGLYSYQTLQYDRLRIGLTFNENGNSYTGTIDLTYSISPSWVGIGANSFIGEGQEGVNIDVTPLYYCYESDGVNAYQSGFLKSTALYTQPTYLSNYGVIHIDDYVAPQVKLGIHIEYKDSSVMLTRGDEDYYYAKGYAEGGKVSREYFENEIIPQIEEEHIQEVRSSYSEGYQAGKEAYENTSSEMNSIFNGIATIGVLPINFFLTMLNWEVFGINIGAFVSATISILIIVMVFRFIFKGKASE